MYEGKTTDTNGSLLVLLSKIISYDSVLGGVEFRCLLCRNIEISRDSATKRESAVDRELMIKPRGKRDAERATIDGLKERRDTTGEDRARTTAAMFCSFTAKRVAAERRKRERRNPYLLRTKPTVLKGGEASGMRAPLVG